MKISFVGHASVLVESGPVHLLMDPWLKGEAFNESWTLHPDPVLAPETLAGVTHLWISHQHPDHLSIPTLKGIPPEVRAGITALFQTHYTSEIRDFLVSLQFKEVIELPRASFYPLGPGVEIYCRQVGHLDSSLAVRADGQVLLNINDCEPPVATLRSMLRHLGPVDVLLTQFSIAGWPGNPGETRRKEAARQRVMEKFMREVETVQPRHVIPFASFVRFSHRENAHMNLQVNTIDDIVDRVDSSKLVVMYPGDQWDLAEAFTGGARAIERYREDFRRIKELPTRVHDTVPLDKVLAATEERLADLRKRYQGALLRWIPPVTFFVEDLNQALEVDVRHGVKVVDTARSDCHVVLSSQAMWYSFAFRWGLPTLGVSGRFLLNTPERPFRRLKKLGSLYSEGIYTREGSSLFNARLFRYLIGRRGDLYSQYIRRVT